MKLANKRGNEVGPEVVEEVDGDAVNVVSNTQLKVGSTQLGTMQYEAVEHSCARPGLMSVHHSMPPSCSQVAAW